MEISPQFIDDENLDLSGIFGYLIDFDGHL